MATITTTVSCPGCCQSECLCSCLGEGWQDTPPDCLELLTQQVTADDCGYNCSAKTCYKCAPCQDCVYDGEPVYEPECTEYCVWETFTQTVTIGSSTPGCENCFEIIEQEVAGCDYTCPCPCEDLAGGWQSTEPECPEGYIVQTTTLTADELGYEIGNCAASTCYRCVLENDPCQDCVYDGEPQYAPDCTEYCAWETFTQTVTIGSSTPGCEDCYQIIEQQVNGCNYNCPCSCSELGEGWQNSAPNCPEGYVLETSSVNAEQAGLPSGNCATATCYKCVPDEGSPSEGPIGNP